ncbi:MAG: putative transposase [Paraglaciecola psychrophila]|jgi:putative transposase
MDDKTPLLYAQAMTTREIVTMFKNLFGANGPPMLIVRVNDALYR